MTLYIIALIVCVLSFIILAYIVCKLDRKEKKTDTRIIDIDTPKEEIIKYPTKSPPRIVTFRGQIPKRAKDGKICNQKGAFGRDKYTRRKVI